ncbi:MAG: hypothetical protein GYB33_22810 [Gammaproteobacteria bacterium]|nr:hypothetical protein [Gammaproteobacteria bacterium]
MQNIDVKRLRTKAVFKIVMLGLIVSLVPLFAICGFLASAGLVSLQWGDQPLTGFRAILAGPFIGLSLAIFFGLFNSALVSSDLMLYGLIRPLKIEYYPKENDCSDLSGTMNNVFFQISVATTPSLRRIYKC